MDKKKKRQGFTALRRRDPNLYTGWTNHIRVCTDVLDWGFLHANMIDKPRANKDHKERLIAWTEWQAYHVGPKPQRPRTLALWRIEDHGQDEATYYYTSNPREPWAVLLLDVDDKDGSAGDAPEVFQLLTALWPNIYGQTSTFEKGYHGYLIIHYPDVSLAAFRALCSELEATLIRVVADHGFKSTIEVKGIPPLIDSDGVYITCGELAKFPRLSTDDQIKDYLARPVYNVSDLQSVIAAFAPFVPTTINEEEREGGEEAEEDFQPPADIPILSAESSVPTTINEEEREGGGNPLWSPSPAERMGNVSRDLVRRLRRVHTVDELLIDYERHGMATGEDDDGNRATLAEGQTEWQEINYDPAAHGGQYQTPRVDLPTLINLVATHVTDDIREAIYASNRSAYTNEQLAAAIHAIEVAATTRHRQERYQFTVGNQFLIDWMGELGVAIDGKEDAQRRKCSAIKRALVASGLAVWVDEHYDKGTCKRMALGPVHPRHHANLPLPAVVDNGSR